VTKLTVLNHSTDSKQVVIHAVTTANINKVEDLALSQEDNHGNSSQWKTV